MGRDARYLECCACHRYQNELDMDGITRLNADEVNHGFDVLCRECQENGCPACMDGLCDQHQPEEYPRIVVDGKLVMHADCYRESVNRAAQAEREQLLDWEDSR